MRKIWLPLIASTLLIVSLFTVKFTSATRPNEGPVRPFLPSAEQINSGTLINGDFDQLAFYWRPTNHYVGGQWFEWWGNYTTIPEFIDGGINLHNVCYPTPADGVCHNPDIGYYNSSQGYIRWGAPYIAGIYQPVSGVTPCTLYEFKIYNRNDAWGYHPKVGIDPTGWIITRIGTSPPENCPPDGISPCPDPYIGAFPATTIWSPEFDHQPYTWAPGSVTAEAVSTTISVWTYAAPEVAGSMSTYWDAGTLTQVPFPNGKLPAPNNWSPTGYIYDVVTTKGVDTLTIDWKTTGPASTQAWYEITPYTPPISSTIMISHTVFLPFVAKGPNPAQMTDFTTVDITPMTNHHVVISRLKPGDTISFVPLSRRPDNATCTTETYTPITIEFSYP